MRGSWILVWVMVVGAGCQLCSSGEYLDSRKVCQQCDISCATCYSSDGCTTCYQQMFMVSKGNTVVCDLCYNINKGCTTCQSAAKCTRCSNGYYLLPSGTCSPCSSLTPNCLLCNKEGTVCLSCESPYQMVFGACWKNSTVITANNGGQVTIPNKATPTNGATVGVGESKKEESMGKNKCEANYVAVNGICFIVIPYCVNYLPGGSCQLCVESYTLNQGYCLPAVLMATIAAGQTAAASQIPPAVQKPQKVQTSQSRPTCAANQYISNGVCTTIGRECLNFTTAGKCLACDVGFSVYNGLCIQRAPPAPANAFPTIAAQYVLQDDYSQAGGVAVSITVDPQCVSPCATCEVWTPQFCLSCIAGFTNVDDIPGRCFKF